MRLAREQFMTDGYAGPPAVQGKTPSVRRVVLEPWARSRRSGVDPDRARPPVDLVGAGLTTRRRGHVIAPLMPLVRRLLVDGDGSEGLLVALADAFGRLLWVEGNAAVRCDVGRVGFVEGACCVRGLPHFGTRAPCST